MPVEPISRVRITAAVTDPVPAAAVGLAGDFATVLDNLVEEGRRLLDLQDRQQILLDAIITVGSDLSLSDVLARVVTSATRLAGARYGALGVVGPDGAMSDFVHSGIPASVRDEIGSPPVGRGLLGLLIADPRPLRLDTIAEHPASVGFPPGHPPMAAFLGVPIRAGNRVYGNLYLSEKATGSTFSDTDERLVVVLATAAGIAIENARLFETSSAQQRWSTAGAAVSAALLGESRDAGVQPAAAIAAAVLTAGPFAAVSVDLTGDDGPAVTGSDDDARRIVTAGPAPDTSSDRHVTSWTLEGPSGPVGRVRAVTHPSAGGLPAAVDGFAADFCTGAAQAVELARARRDRDRLSLLEDRDRIARDLHDVVVQRLFATGLSLEGLRKRAPDPATAARLDDAVHDLDETIGQIRRTIFSLRSTSRAGVRALVTSLVDAAADGSPGVRPLLWITGPVDLAVPAEMYGDVEAVVTEALSNAARHAPGAAVRVEVAVTDDTLTVRVADEGPGIGDTTRRSGLANLADRAQRRGGTCTTGSVETDPLDGVTGTTVVWSVPIPAEA